MKDKLRIESLVMFENSTLVGDSPSLDNQTAHGEFHEKVLVITNKLGDKGQEKEFLDKMLAAVNLKAEDLWHIELEGVLPTIWQEINKARPIKIICFGNFLDTPALTFKNLLYKRSTINGIDVLVSNELSEIIDSPEYKKALWSSLKKMFHIR